MAKSVNEIPPTIAENMNSTDISGLPAFKVVSTSTQYRVSYNAITRQYRVAIGLLSQTFDGLDEVERFLSRVNSRQVATLDQLVKGARYEAALRLRLDINALPKPFQISALASRDWSMQSEWYRWSFTP